MAPPGGQSRAPLQGGPAAPAPADTTVARLLLDLGYLDRDGFGDDSARNAAIRNAERDRGLPRTGRPTPALLAQLLAEARRNILPPPKVSMVVTRQGHPSTD